MRRTVFIYTCLCTDVGHNSKTGANVAEMLRIIFQKVIRKGQDFQKSKPFNRQFLKFWEGNEMKLLFLKDFGIPQEVTLPSIRKFCCSIHQWKFHLLIGKFSQPRLNWSIL